MTGGGGTRHRPTGAALAQAPEVSCARTYARVLDGDDKIKG
jgi:hypothetical protein